MADDSSPVIFGWDASDYDWDRGPMDLAAARADGIDWFTHKATEATHTRHVHYGEALRRARDAGIPILGAYHVVRSPLNAAAEVDFMLSYVDDQTPWWREFPCWFWQVDLEQWPYDSVPAFEGEDFADVIEARTGRKAIIYASRGQYGDQLSGTSHELWNANYGSNPTAHFRDVYASRGGDSGAGWATYSGRTPIIWQYGSRTTIGRQNICDANAFRGMLDQLAAILNGDTDMAGVLDGIHGEALIWRVEAMFYHRPAVVGGPHAGKPEGKSELYEAIESLRLGGVDPAAVAAALAPLLPTPAQIAAATGDLEAEAARAAADVLDGPH